MATPALLEARDSPQPHTSQHGPGPLLSSAAAEEAIMLTSPPICSAKESELEQAGWPGAGVRDELLFQHPWGQQV